MAADKQHINYSSEDIHQYLSGKLSPAQMHAMEKAALNDPLLADAIDGYSEVDFTSQPGYDSVQNDLAELRRKIDNSTTVSINKYKNRWWQVAAVVFILAGAFAFALYKLNNNSKNNTTELATNKTIQQADPVVANKSADAPAMQDSAVTIAALEKPSTKETIEPERKSQPASPVQQFNDSNVADMQNTAAQYDDAATSDAAKEERIVERRDFPKYANKRTKALGAEGLANSIINIAFAGKVIDDNAAAVPYATIIINNTKESRTDANGMFNINLNDSIATITALSKNYMATTTRIYHNKYNTVTLSPKKIVLKNALSKQEAAKNNNRSFVYILSKGNTEPVGGWEKYEQHLTDLLSGSEYDDGNLVTGDMIVSFEISTNFAPVHFTFEKSINSDVDEAIEQLIKNESDWKAAGNKSQPGGTIRLKIVF